MKIKNKSFQSDYPEKIIEVMNQFFPKGDKRRGDALVLQALAFIEGKNHSKKELEEAREHYFKLEQDYLNLYEEIERILDEEIENEKNAVKRKAHRNWTIVMELEFIKRKLKEKNI